MALDPRLRFGLKLIEIRKTRGWSQERLALESGLARSYLLIRQALFVNLARAEVSKPLDGLKLNGIGTLQ